MIVGMGFVGSQSVLILCFSGPRLPSGFFVGSWRCGLNVCGSTSPRTPREGSGMNGTSQYPAPGEMMPDFELVATNDTHVRVSDYRGRRHLVLIFIGLGNSDTARDLLRRFSKQYAEFDREDAQVLVIVRGDKVRAENLGPDGSFPFPVLLDDGSRVHDMVGASKPEAECRPVVCLIDRYGEFRQEFRAEGLPAADTVEAILDWVRYINLECPE